MKVTVKIENQLFEVEIENLYTRPIVATISGQKFEVWPEVGGPVVTPAGAAPAAPATKAYTAVPAAPGSTDPDAIYAPIPGVIVSIGVEEGQRVAVGQELCVLEAMKMKNTIRAPREGEIAAVRIAVGQHVRHHEVLFEYAG